MAPARPITSAGMAPVLDIDVTWAPGRSVRMDVAGDGPPLLLAPGAGAGQDHPLNAALRSALLERGMGVASFDYPYITEGRRSPDPPETLLECHRAASRALADHAGEDPGRVVLAGRSMGGRMASMLAASGHPCRALVLYAYPLHPTGRPERLRVEHLPRIEVPVLSFRGSNDSMSRPGEYDRWVRPLPMVTTVDLEGVDHGWRGKGISMQDVVDQVAEETARWLDGVS
jgi:uncharacterized protein